MKTIIDFTNKVKSLVDGRMSNIANVEESPSTHAYAVGKQLIFNGLLCKATSAISVGDTLAVGTNLALSDNVVEQIYSLNQGLTNSLNEIADMNNVLGAKNLLPNKAVSKTVNGITFTVNSDGSITANGTATSASSIILTSSFNLVGGEYILSDEANSTDTKVQIILETPDATQRVAACYGAFRKYKFTLSQAYFFKCFIWIGSGTEVDNVRFKPMIRPASIQDDTYVPYSMTNREMTPYVQSISNPNLLDNPWFTVNQRGANSYTGSTSRVYTFDRWCIAAYSSDITVTDNNDGTITIANTGTNNNFQFSQFLESDLLISGKTYTLTCDVVAYTGSVKMLLAGNVSPYPNILYKSINKTGYLSGKGVYDGTSNTYKVSFSLDANSSITIKAVKLELGSVSTLAMDTAPNYTTELLKCQRYFVRFGSNESVPAYTYNFGMAYEVNSSSAYFNVMIPIPMRSTPLISYQGSWAIGSKALNNITVDSMFNNIVKLVCTTSQTFTAGEVELLENKEAGTSYIDFTSDL